MPKPTQSQLERFKLFLAEVVGSSEVPTADVIVAVAQQLSTQLAQSPAPEQADAAQSHAATQVPDPEAVVAAPSVDESAGPTAAEAREQLDQVVAELDLSPREAANVDDAVSAVQALMASDPEMQELIAELSAEELAEFLELGLANAIGAASASAPE